MGSESRLEFVLEAETLVLHASPTLSLPGAPPAEAHHQLASTEQPRSCVGAAVGWCVGAGVGWCVGGGVDVGAGIGAFVGGGTGLPHLCLVHSSFESYVPWSVRAHPVLPLLVTHANLSGGVGAAVGDFTGLAASLAALACAARMSAGYSGLEATFVQAARPIMSARNCMIYGARTAAGITI